VALLLEEVDPGRCGDNELTDSVRFRKPATPPGPRGAVAIPLLVGAELEKLLEAMDTVDPTVESGSTITGMIPGAVFEEILVLAGESGSVRLERRLSPLPVGMLFCEPKRVLPNWR